MWVHLMKKNPLLSDIGSLPVSVVYKRSRYSYALDHASDKEQKMLLKHSDPISHELFVSHENNRLCLEKVGLLLKNLGVPFTVFCRDSISLADLENRFVISVGGDGTLLDASHYCTNSPLLGVNSDPNTSIGALCAADSQNIESILEQIYAETLKPFPVTRLAIALDDKPLAYTALNDVLFCHVNPAAMTRFTLQFDGNEQAYRSSGIWVATGAGSTGGIYSSGGKEFDIDAEQGMFRLREPYWSASTNPQLLTGTFNAQKPLIITSTMSEAKLFIDGPHKTHAVGLGQQVKIAISDQPLWLFDKERIVAKRQQILEQRKSFRTLLKTSFMK